MSDVFHNPPNYLAQIDEIWAILSVDEGGEGLCAAPLRGMTIPLIAADKARLDSFLIPMAEQLADVFGKKLKLVKFHNREEIREFLPTTKD